MKILEIIFALITMLLFTSSLYGGFNLIEKEKQIIELQEKHEMLKFINNDFHAKCDADYFHSHKAQKEWLDFIKNYFAIDVLKLIVFEKEESFIYALEIFFRGEKYKMKYARRIYEK